MENTKEDRTGDHAGELLEALKTIRPRLTNNIAGKLTEKQVERAASVGGEAWSRLGERNWNQIAVLMAPHLQFPIAELTAEELEAAAKAIKVSWSMHTLELLRAVIANRNARMAEKVDPRREAVAKALSEFAPSKKDQFADWYEIAGVALKALDEMEAAK